MYDSDEEEKEKKTLDKINNNNKKDESKIYEITIEMILKNKNSGNIDFIYDEDKYNNNIFHRNNSSSLKYIDETKILEKNILKMKKISKIANNNTNIKIIKIQKILNENKLMIITNTYHYFKLKTKPENG